MFWHIVYSIMRTLQVLHCLSMGESIGYLALSTLANVAIDIDDKDFIGHVNLAQVHSV